MRCLAVLLCLAITPVVAADDPSPLQPSVALPAAEATLPAADPVDPLPPEAASPAIESGSIQPQPSQPPRVFQPARNVFELIPAYVRPVESIVPSTTQPVYEAPKGIIVAPSPYRLVEKPVPPSPAFTPQPYDFTPPARHIEECGIQRPHTSNTLQQVGHEATDRVPPAPASTGLDVRSEIEFQSAIRHFEVATKHLRKTGDENHARLAASLQEAIGELVQQRAVHHQRLADFYGRIGSQRSGNSLKNQSSSRAVLEPYEPRDSVAPRWASDAPVPTPPPQRSAISPANEWARQTPRDASQDLPYSTPTVPYRDAVSPLATSPTTQFTPSYNVVPAGAYDLPPQAISKPIKAKNTTPIQQVVVRCQIVDLSNDASKKLFEGLNSRLNNGVLSVLGLRDRKSPSQVHVLESADWQEHLKALRADKQCKVLAEPTLAVQTGHTASFLSGGEVPILAADGKNTKSIEFRSFGTQLTAKATVLESGKIRLDLTPEISTLSYVNSSDRKTQFPAITSRRIQTTVTVEPSQTIVLGGIANAKTATIIAVSAEIVEPLDAVPADPQAN